MFTHVCLFSRSCNCSTRIGFRRWCQFLCPLQVFRKLACNQPCRFLDIHFFSGQLLHTQLKRKLKRQKRHHMGNVLTLQQRLRVVWRDCNDDSFYVFLSADRALKFFFQESNKSLPNKTDVNTFILTFFMSKFLERSSVSEDSMRTVEPPWNSNWYLYESRSFQTGLSFSQQVH